MAYPQRSAPAAVTLLWHDYETTGTHKQLDRPTQFASVRTDEDLNIIPGSETMYYCQPSPETLMHPMAAMVTGITPQECAEKGLIEADFCRAVIQQLGKGGTCGTGYNTIAFDDEISRNLFYRNFRDPYEREWKGGNSRWDLITAVRLFAALRPEGIVWPIKDDGRPSQRLEDLAKANGLKQERAHDALSDVYATIQLAQLLKQTNPKLWEHAYGLREKAKVQAVANLMAGKPFVHVAPYYDHGGTAVMFPVGPHPQNKNGILAVNLSQDLAPLFELDAKAIAERLFGSAAGDEESEKPARLPLTMIQINKAPPVAPFNALRAEDRARLGYSDEDIARIQANQQDLMADPVRFDAMVAKLQEAFVISSARFAAPADPELGIYGGFPSAGDKALMEKVKNANATQLAAGGFVFQDPKFNELLFRYRARNWPGSLSDEEQTRWETYCITRLTTHTPATTITLEAFREKVAELQVDPVYAAQPAKQAVLSDLVAWADTLENGWAASQEPDLSSRAAELASIEDNVLKSPVAPTPEAPAPTRRTFRR